MNADKLIAEAEKASADYMKRTGCTHTDSKVFELGWMRALFREACDAVAAATNPSDCHDVTIDGITYGMQWDKGDECWLAYIGGQVVNVALSSELIDKLCDEAERIALDGEAA